MPGILPMKVIKVGNSAQSRIAQACDRCRSKKIRCDGVRPCCTQCANVGFECKTSDKLSRRAFPRGYTESLEERVRALETEVKELKDLLDEKDEKIDVLSRIHSFSPSSQQKASAAALSPSQPAKLQPSDPSEGAIHVPSPPESRETPGVPSGGVSSTQGFNDVFTNRLIELGRLPSTVSTKALTTSPAVLSHFHTDQAIQTAPRLVSDQLINIFFQEWAPLYPVVHRPTILKAYEQYLSTDSLQGGKHDLAQLNLIFGTAALTSGSRTNQDPTFFEENWVPTLETLSSDVSVPTLQCFVLAQMYCMTRGDYSSLLRYRGLAVSLCQQLRLHQSQKCLSSNALAAETRKKVFWCQYVLDRFTAALTGLPVLLREGDIRTEYPEDIDDENVTESGFLPTLPGESTRISGAIALFSASRILNKTLEDLYPADGDYDIPVSKVRALSGQLDSWEKNLAPHLRLEFSQDKPSTNVTSSRSPLLSLVYYFIRSLIHRPAVCFGEEQIRSPSVLALADSSKHIVQILQLLDERRLCLSLSISRKEVIFTSGLGLLWQNVGLKRESKLVKEGQKLLTTIIELLEAVSSPAAAEFSGMASVLFSLDGNRRRSASKPHKEMSPPTQRSSKSPKKQPLETLKAQLMAHADPQHSVKTESHSRRATISGDRPPTGPRQSRSNTWAGLPPDPLAHPPPMADPAYFPPHSFGYDPCASLSHSAPSDPAAPLTMSDWEVVLGDMDRGYSNIFTGIYGGKECGEDSGPFASLTAEYAHKPEHLPASLPTAPSEAQGLSPAAWSASSTSDLPANHAGPAQSVLSFSDESLGGADEKMPYKDHHLHMSPEQAHLMDPFRSVMVPTVDEEVDEFALGHGWNRRLAV
ncbi:acetate regulatory DNA binding protein FacB [Aspergillus campestris IBT 28561]|uniref:Acetate regulatory DNA binding protein FacB n=1 Tax=Aspergillus campestris (strain IBT 28561) TaxID=1392248 RepID=A0A2I1DGB8_ASPC2|nr:acetate regulatory DNA binding protein FacB [Aspergillus campestris IBT 28561]PKY08914.1 acetate regulatory DNA binding protein FacB [Aspergillus campestris IBT 28561]